MFKKKKRYIKKIKIQLVFCFSAKFQPKKYDFNLCKGFFIEKIAQIH
jgi:hypothetical protein